MSDVASPRILPTSLESSPSADRLAMDSLWRLVAVMLPFVVANTGRVNYLDFWWSSATGRDIVTTGQFPSASGLFFTPIIEQFPWSQWLGHVLMFTTHSLTGLPGVILLRATLASFLSWLLLVACERAGARAPVAAGLAVAGSVFALVGLAERPQMFAAIPFAVFCLLLVPRSRRRIAFFLALPPLMVFWVNVHGSFVLGVGLVGLYWLDQVSRVVATRLHSTTWDRHNAALVLKSVRRSLLSDREVRLRAILVLTVGLASLVSPLGLRSWSYAFAIQNNEVIRRAALEWQPTSVRETYGWLFFGALALMAVFATARSARPSLIPSLAFGVFTILTLVAVRNGVWWAIVAAPYCAQLATRIDLRDEPRHDSANAPLPIVLSPPPALSERFTRFRLVLTAALVVFSVATFPYLRPFVPWGQSPGVGAFESAESPVGLAVFARDNGVSGNVFADANLTTYLSESTRGVPARFFLDCRYELHPPEVWIEYGRILGGHANWDAVLARYDVDWLILDSKASADLLPLVRSSSRWREVYTDQQGAVFQRAHENDQ